MCKKCVKKVLNERDEIGIFYIPHIYIFLFFTLILPYYTHSVININILSHDT